MEEKSDLFEFKVSGEAEQQLTEASRWSKVMAIMVLSVFGLVVLLVLAVGNNISAILDQQMTSEEADTIHVTLIAVGVVAAIVVGLMMFFLLRSAKRIKNGLFAKNQSLFNSGLNDLKVYFIIFGIISILSLVGSLLSLA